jgi:hypothetical protein
MAELDYSDFENHIASPVARDTEKEWGKVLFFCKQKQPIGVGLLDSFLSGPDIERRIDLVKEEVKTNVWLRLELCDTVHISSATNPTDEQLIQGIKKIV